jgi:hypothetical protein
MASIFDTLGWNDAAAAQCRAGDVGQFWLG